MRDAWRPETPSHHRPTMLSDLRFAARQLVKAPGFTAVALLTLGLGIGSCTCMFSVINSVLFRPLPYPNSDQLILIREQDPPQFPEFSVAPGNFFDWRAQSTVFQNLAAIRFRPESEPIASRMPSRNGKARPQSGQSGSP